MSTQTWLHGFVSQKHVQTSTVMIRSFRTDRSGQTVQTLEEQSDQGLHCLLFHLHLVEENP